MSALKRFLSPQYEPVRAWLYGIAVAGIAIAVLFKWLTGEQGAAIAALISAVLLIPIAEIVRTQTASYQQVVKLRTPDGQTVAGPAAVVADDNPSDVTPPDARDWCGG